MKRRLFPLQLIGAVLLVSRQGWAGTYLDRAALLVSAADEELGYLRRKANDLDMARMIHRVAVARLAAASEMAVPPEVVQAHPHLLLLLENCERAANAVIEKRAEQFQKFLRLAREEEELFRAVLRHLGWTLPRPRD
jgi:hypothetical protein